MIYSNRETYYKTRNKDVYTNKITMDNRIMYGVILSVCFLLMIAKGKNAYKRNSGNFLPFCIPIPFTGTEICLKTPKKS